MSVRRLVLHAGGALLHATGAFRLAHRRLVPENVCVLMYHGLTSGPLPVADGCFLRAERFAAQMEYLSAHFEVVHLEEALVRRGAPGARPIACVTFDDGFASVHDLALPILRRLRIPATVYLVTDLIDTDQTLWFARLHQAICQTAALEVRLGEQCVSLRGPAARERASAALQLALKRLERPAFSVALEDVLARLGYAGAATPPWGAFRILTSAQVRVMAGDGLVRFGAHTATHQILT
ncbi:MAG: polysaccharide deacetylase family protein, partial [Xanthobacteraceae bacterium]